MKFFYAYFSNHSRQLSSPTGQLPNAGISTSNDETGAPNSCAAAGGGHEPRGGFPYDEKRDQYIFQNTGPVEDITLSVAEFATVDYLLTACIKEYNQAQVVELEDMRKAVHKEYPNVQLHEERYLINLPRYKRQLVAVTNAKGEKVVWVNCFCHEGNQACWRHQLIEVDDGGNCYFNIKLNLTRRTWYDVMVNGVA